MLLELLLFQENNKAIEQKESNHFMDNDDGIYF